MVPKITGQVQSVKHIILRNGSAKHRFVCDPATGDFHDTINPTIVGRITNRQFGIYSGGMPLPEGYEHLNEASKVKATRFFNSRTATQPHLKWMEQRFLRMLEMVATNAMTNEVASDSIEVVDPSDKQYFSKYENFGRNEERLRELGADILGKGKLLVIDLVAGMATGFGGTAKGAVQAHLDARYENERGITYLDIKRGNYLRLQRESKSHLIAAVMVSDPTEKDIIASLETFAKNNSVNLVLIRDGASRSDVEKIWKEHKDDWENTIIVPIIRQPTTLYVSKDGKEAGEEYMKGHGDFYDVVKSQLKDIFAVMGIEYVFTSNIDNTGSMVSRAILGHLVEQMQQEQIDAILEVAEKFEGDKGGTPALVNGKFTILEGAFVPAEWKDRYNGREIFPYFNTNTFWFSAKALLNNEFKLPMMTSKVIDDKWLKVESIMGHGLESIKWKALVVDRGLRFLPAKFLTDLWTGRSDWMRWVRGRLMPVMRDGEYVQKPLTEISKATLSAVSDLNARIFMNGQYDSMKELKTLVIGGEGKHFHKLGDFTTKCGVCYKGDVAIIFEHKEGKTPGILIIQGASEADEITLEDSVIFVPAGQSVIINKSNKGKIDPDIKRKDLEAFLVNASRWTDKQRKRVLEKFFPSEDILPTLNEYFSHEYLQSLTDTAREHAEALLKVFNVSGLIHYEVMDTKGDKVTIEAKKIIGSAKTYRSKAEGRKVEASSSKSALVIEGDRIDVNSAAGAALVTFPIIKDGITVTLITLHGKYNEQYPSAEKINLLKGKSKQVIELLSNKGITDNDQISKEFSNIAWGFLLENTPNEIATQIQKRIINS
ncbi:UTP--glucose-1-phosphate uridylyltransferase [Candidatus Margulisiibacteriota bacterium]